MGAPLPPAESVWSRGSRTVSQAMAETGLSRDEIWERMNDGTFHSFPHGGHRRRLIAWGDIVDYLDGLHREHMTETGASARTA